MIETNLLKPNEAAKMLGITTETLGIWRSTGRYDLPYVKIGRLVKYKLSDIEDFINRRSRQHTGQEVA